MCRAGKTTLLDILAGRNKATGTLTGDILVNGHPQSGNFKYVSAYVMQDDVLLGSLTVMESLEYTAKLRMLHATSDEVAAKVASLLEMMGLEKCSTTLVGSARRRGISGFTDTICRNK